MRTHQLIALASLVALAAACGGSGSGGGTPTAPGSTGGTTTGGGTDPYGGGTPAQCTPGNGTVCLTTDNSFNPSSITITAGTTVTWNNPTGTTHNVTFSTAGAPGNIADFSSGTHSLTFPTAGTYHYNCTIHGTSMSGTVVVQ